jgi:hypothetical protein
MARIIFFASLLFLVSCANSSFEGGSAGTTEKKKDQNSNEEEPDQSDKKPKKVQSDDGIPGDHLNTDDGEDDPESVLPITPLVSDEVIDGHTVTNTCNACLDRGKVLASQAGFTADWGLSINFGAYKVDSTKNLCDVHFLADPNVIVSDHGANDGIGNGHVYLYCPCDCQYAQDMSSGSGFPPF